MGVLMAKTPYPGYPPSYQVVEETGGYHRTCVVVELLSLGKLSGAELALVQEQLEACVEKLKNTMVVLEGAQVVMPDRFDPVLRGGLRLS